MKPLESKGECEIREHGEVRVITLRYGNMWFCNECWDLEQKLSSENQSVAKQEERVKKVNDVVLQAKKVDSLVELREDIYNAETVSIEELRQAINKDEKIENKIFALAEVIAQRKLSYSKLIFDKRAEIAELQIRERADQSILNQLVSNLRAEEREKLKLQDVSYQPKSPKVIKPKGEPKVTSKAFKLSEVKKAAEQYGFTTAAIQGVVAARKVSVEEAVNILVKLTSD